MEFIIIQLPEVMPIQFIQNHLTPYYNQKKNISVNPGKHIKSKLYLLNCNRNRSLQNDAFFLQLKETDIYLDVGSKIDTNVKPYLNATKRGSSENLKNVWDQYKSKTNGHGLNNVLFNSSSEKS